MNNPTLAVIYDFDGTLAPGSMQNHRFIPETGMATDKFWELVEGMALEHQMDPTLSYMFVMTETARKAGIPVRREDLMSKADELVYFPGVEDWFERTNNHGRRMGVDIEHYVISSGNSEIIEGTSIAHHFKKIYASKFLYDDAGNAIWPALAINFTTKTQYLFRINKNAHDVNDRKVINDYRPRAERAVPFEQMIYIGDGETDVPCFRVVKDMGGLSIAVYDEGCKANADVYLEQGRVNCTAEADYRENKRLDRLVRAYTELVAR